MVQLHHPHILHVFGMCTTPGEMCIVMEYMTGGTLFKMLYQRPGNEGLCICTGD